VFENGPVRPQIETGLRFRPRRFPPFAGVSQSPNGLLVLRIKEELGLQSNEVCQNGKFLVPASLRFEVDQRSLRDKKEGHSGQVLIREIAEKSQPRFPIRWKDDIRYVPTKIGFCSRDHEIQCVNWGDAPEQQLFSGKDKMKLSDYDDFPTVLPIVVEDELFFYPFMISPIFLSMKSDIDPRQCDGE